MVTWLLSALYWTWVGISCVLLFAGAVVVLALTALFDRRLIALHMYTSVWASLYLWTNPAWQVEIRGRDRIPRDRACVMVSNHQSLVDILALFRLFTPFKWVAKVELFSLPLVGWNMRMNRYIALKRGDPASIQHMYTAAERALSAGSSVCLFPEGTRSATVEVRPFKHGAFVLAQKMRVPIIPLAISGSHNALPKHSLLLRGHHRVIVSVMDPIEHDEFADDPPDLVAERVREQIRTELEQLA